MRKWLLLAGLLGLGLTGWAQPVVVTGDHQNQVIAGEGKDVVIEGHHLNVVVTGKSACITISGHHNDVVLEEPRIIDASGHHNDIVYQRGNPEIRRTGSYNDFGSGTGKEAVTGAPQQVTSANTVAITGSGSQRSEEGQGRHFLVSGSGHNLTIRGRAASVTVSGTANVVEVEQTDLITVGGMSNTVYYKKGDPVMSKGGLENQILRR